MVLGMEKLMKDQENRQRIKHLIVDANHQELSSFIQGKEQLVNSEIMELADYLASGQKNANHPAVQTQMVVDIATRNTVDINDAFPFIGVFFPENSFS